MDDAWLNYLSRECRLANAGQYFPDLTVRRYDFAPALVDEAQIRRMGNDPESLMDFLSRNDLKPKYGYRLREVFGCYDGGRVPDLESLKTYMDPRVHTPEIESCRRKVRNLFMDENGGQSHLVLSSIRTAKGAVFFPPTGRGYLQRRALLQYIADRFFCAEGMELGYVRKDILYNYTDRERELSRQSASMFSLEDDSFLPGKARWSDCTPTDENVIGNDFRILPAADAFRAFAEAFGVEVSQRNRNVGTLLFIAQNGCPVHMQRSKAYADFSELGSFARLDQLMNMVLRKFPEHSERFYRVQNRQQLLARDILRDKYGVIISEPKLTGTSVQQETSPVKKRQDKRKTLRRIK